ncbi:MAG: AAA family ATPase [Gaiellaceae bacterium]
MAESSLVVGARVIVDAVNPVEAARQPWRDLAARTSTRLRVIEVVCSEQIEHRRRVETRHADLEGSEMPTWAELTAREYEPWREPRLVVDTRETLTECLAQIEEYLSS